MFKPYFTHQQQAASMSQHIAVDIPRMFFRIHIIWSKVAVFGEGHPTFNRNPYGYISPNVGLMTIPYGNNDHLQKLEG